MSTENLKVNHIQNTVNQSDIDYYIEKSLDKFSNETSNKGYWKLYDKNNLDDDGDQIKTVFGICFTFFALLILGSYSCLL